MRRALACLLASLAVTAPAYAQPDKEGKDGPKAEQGQANGRPQNEPAAEAPAPDTPPQAQAPESAAAEPAPAADAPVQNASPPANQAAAPAPSARTAARPQDTVARAAGTGRLVQPRRSGARPVSRAERRAATASSRAAAATRTGLRATERPAARTEPASTPTAEPRREAPAAETAGVLQRTVVRVVDRIPLKLIGLAAALALLLGGIAAAVTLRARRLRHQRDGLAADLIAALQPPLPARAGAADVSLAAAPGPHRFHDVVRLPGDRTGLLVGQAPGLPLTAAAHIRYTLRSHLERGLEPREVLDESARTLFEELDHRPVRATIAVYDSLTGQLTFACAGAPEPVITGAEAPEPIGPASPALGSATSAGAHQVTIALPPGATAAFDGHLALRPPAGAAAAPPRRTDELRIRARDLTTLQDVLDGLGTPATSTAEAVRVARRLIGRQCFAHLAIRRAENWSKAEIGAAADGDAEWCATYLAQPQPPPA
jgi:hypothetical protein